MVFQNSLSAKQSRDQISGMLFSAPCILGFLFFAALPMLISLYLSFTDYTVSKAPEWVGLANYLHIFSGNDPYFYKSLLVTVYYVIFAVPTSLIAAFAIAMLLNSNVKAQGLLRTIFYLPSIVPVIAMSAIWVWIFNPSLGLANLMLKSIGMQPNTWIFGEKTVIPTLIFINLWNIGPTMIIFLAGLQDVPRQLLEAVDIDGGGFWSRLWHVTVPMMTPTIFYNLVLGFINGFQVFTQAYVMTQGGPNNASSFYVFYLYREAFRFSKYGSASAIAWILFIIISVLTAILFKVQKNWVYYGGGEN